MNRHLFWAVGVALATQSWTASAQPAAPPEPQADSAAPAEDPLRTQARELFMAGVNQVKLAQWAGALESFEKSAKLFPHATTTFNIGACERAMGRYTRARVALKLAMAQAARGEGSLAESLQEEARGYLSEISNLVVRLRVKLDTAGASITVDGRPLAAQGKQHVAGIRPAGRGAPAPSGSFLIVMDPGARVITLSRKGYADSVISKTFPPGTKTSLNLSLDRLPATLQISSNVDDAIVTVDGKDFGPAPVSVLRPPGRYSILVNRAGFEPYEATVQVKPGEESALRATLVEEQFQLTEHWWFWAGTAAVIAGGAIATYYLTRPDPEAPPYEAGSTGWLVQPIRF